MLPGVAVLLGIAAPERYSREIVKSTAIGELALAVFAAIIIHSISILLIQIFILDPLDVLRPLIVFETQAKVILVWPLVKATLPKLAAYMVATSAGGFAAGFFLAKLIQSGFLGGFATHNWVYDVVRYSKGKKGIVTAYVMTKTVENDRALMHKGRLAEIFLREDGNISYLALKNCRRFYMKFDDLTTTGQQLKLFETAKDGYSFDEWNYLMIGGDEIANVLFNKSPDIIENSEGLKALEAALQASKQPDDVVDNLSSVVDPRASD